MEEIIFTRRKFFRGVPDERFIPKLSADELRRLYERLAGKLEMFGVRVAWPKLDQDAFKGLTRQEIKEKERELLSMQCLRLVAKLKEHFDKDSKEEIVPDP